MPRHSHNLPVSIQVYLGSGKRGMDLREALERKAKASGDSVSRSILDMIKKSDPSLFKGEKNGTTNEK